MKSKCPGQAGQGEYAAGGVDLSVGSVTWLVQGVALLGFALLLHLYYGLANFLYRRLRTGRIISAVP